jgi:hypothetical protein
VLVGASNGVSRHRAFDRWFRYPAGFSPTTLLSALDAVGLEPGTLCVDPFAGSASGGCEVIERGASYIGIEAHPLIAELGDLKFARPGEPSELVEAAETLMQTAELAATDAEVDLVRRCFDEPALGVLVGLRNELLRDPSARWYRHLKWALLGTLRDVATVKVGWPYQRPSQRREPPFLNVRARFLARADMMASDLESASEPPASRVVAGDSRNATTWRRAMSPQSASSCVTSPPYLNNFDYADATRLEVYFWGAASTWAELCHEIRGDMLVATTQQTRQALAASAAEHLALYPGVAASITELTSSLAVERIRRGRGKEYDRVLAPYFVGIARVLSCLHDHLEPGGVCAWIVGDSAPYGVYIDTPGLIARLAEELGFKRGSDVQLRARGERWRTNGTRHQVALSERLVTFSRPIQRARPSV